MILPTLVYKSPGNLKHATGKTYRYIGVETQEQLSKAIAEGWFVSKVEAIFGKKVEVVADDAPPTRLELTTKADELGLKYDGRTSEKKLLIMISDALGKGNELV